MKVLTCAATRRRLHAFHDEELPIGDQIAVGAHLEWCDECAAELAEIRLLGGVLRASTVSHAALSGEEATSLQAGVVNRVKAERTMSFVAQTRALFEDLHLVYAGLGGAAAAVLCVLIMLAMMRLAIDERPHLLSAVVIDVKVLGWPGSNQNPVPPLEPRIQMPRALDQAFPGDPQEDTDSLIMLAGVVTREGTLSNLSVLDPAGGTSPGRVLPSKAVRNLDLLGVASRARFEPATVDGLAVAVNIVWVVEHTTVRAKQSGTVKKRAALVLPPGVIS
jgi:hypothetical protein